jgi:DNA-binding CsgD family transcriptional regulator/cell division protein FtsB
MKKSGWWLIWLMQFILFSGLDGRSAENQFTVFHYKSIDYGGGNQNWDISKDSSGRVFIANNAGLLVFDGSRTRLFELPERTIIRSVSCIGERVYTGSFKEFGFWEERNNGLWEYQSLVSLVDSGAFQNDEIWKIVNLGEKIYFQSFGNIFVYDQKTVTKLDLPGPVLFLLKSGERLFVQEINGGLHEIINEAFRFIPGSEIFEDTEVKTILYLKENEIVIGTSSLGLYRFNGLSFEEWETEATSLLKQFKINNGLLLGDKLVFGTILKGLFVLNIEGKLLHHMHSSNWLQNNTVLALEEDDENNLWVGLDKGFDFVWFHSPIETYRDLFMEAGSVYTAAMFENDLYVGTNQGIYYYHINEKGKFTDRKLLDDSQGQVWFLKVVDEKLYCGLNDGTFVIKDHKLIRVSDVNGGYNFVPIQAGDKNRILQSSYNEIVVFEKKSDIWQKSHTVKGFNAPARYLESDHLGNLFIGHSITGLYLLQPSPEIDSAVHFRSLGADDGIAFKTNKVFKIDGRIVVPSDKGFYQWNALSGRFEIWEELNTQLESFANARTVISLGQNKHWLIKPNEIGMFEIRFGKAVFLYRIIPEMFDLNLIEDYENIALLNDSLHLICLDDGFAILNIYNLNKLGNSRNAPRIKELQFWKLKNLQKIFHKSFESDKKQLSYRFNNISIAFASHETVGRKKYFQYMLEGMDEGWSEWSTNTGAEYFRLPPGNYVFKLKSLTAKGFETEITNFAFRIRPPWYLTYYAFGLYFLLLILFAILLLNYYRRLQWKKQEQQLREENEQIKVRSKQAESELMKLNNERLLDEITSKNMELAKNTMAMIRKNELLIDIRKEFESQKEELGNRLPSKYFNRINKLIESSLNSEHDWEMFEHLFDQAHENFFKRLKQEYPDLTTSDFRLCAYLRMNLSSKEIAPLLNISIRGVEEKRYRLRKKIGLSTEQNLTEFIIGY